MSWRDNLLPASYEGQEFHIESGGHAGGRRIVDFEFPKNDTNYVEDMGRRAKHFQIQAYLIGDDYPTDRDALIALMETEGPGLLVHPTMGEFLVCPDTYQVVEARARANICELELTFVEAGTQSLLGITSSTSAVASAAQNAGTASATSLDKSLSGIDT